MAGRLDGKVAVVTGASSGIGDATVWALAAEGAAVVAGARRKERLDELVEEISTLVLSYLSPDGASDPERTQDPGT